MDRLDDGDSSEECEGDFGLLNYKIDLKQTTMSYLKYYDLLNT